MYCDGAGVLRWKQFSDCRHQAQQLDLSLTCYCTSVVSCYFGACASLLSKNALLLLVLLVASIVQNMLLYQFWLFCNQTWQFRKRSWLLVTVCLVFPVPMEVTVTMLLYVNEAALNCKGGCYESSCGSFAVSMIACGSCRQVLSLWPASNFCSSAGETMTVCIRQ